jgi:hypothetical protein
MRSVRVRPVRACTAAQAGRTCCVTFCDAIVCVEKDATDVLCAGRLPNKLLTAEYRIALTEDRALSQIERTILGSGCGVNVADKRYSAHLISGPTMRSRFFNSPSIGPINGVSDIINVKL